MKREWSREELDIVAELLHEQYHKQRQILDAYELTPEGVESSKGIKESDGWREILDIFGLK